MFLHEFTIFIILKINNMKKIMLLCLSIAITSSLFSQGWDKKIEKLDKNGKRHGFYQVQDTLFSMFGFGIEYKSIDSTGTISIERIVLNSPAFKSNKINNNDTIIGLEINGIKYDLKKMKNEITKNILENNDKIKFIKNTQSGNNNIEVELKKENLIYKFHIHDGITIKGNYNHGKKDGKWEIFDNEGKLVNTRIYKNDKEIKCTGNCKDFPGYADFY
jgi:hypothetical protein